jgi:hypothetical protein
MSINSIKKLIGQAKLSTAFDEAKKLVTSLEVSDNDITHLKSRYERIEEQQRFNVINNEEYSIELNKITKSFLDILVDIQSNKIYPKFLVRKAHFLPRKMLGRENELKKISEILSKKNFMGVSGVGGIGKSTILQRYIKEKEADYDHILLVDVQTDFTKDHEDEILLNNKLFNAFLDKNLLKTMGYEREEMERIGTNTISLLKDSNFASSKLEEGFNAQNTHSDLYVEFKNVLGVLSDIGKHKKMLCIIDNVPHVLKNFLVDLPKGENWHWVIASRTEIDSVESIYLSHLDEDQCIELFSIHYSNTRIEDEKELDELKKILALIGYNTYVIELLAMEARAKRWTLTDLSDYIKKQGILLRSSGTINIELESNDNGRPYELLLKRFSIAALNEQERYILTIMAYLPPEEFDWKVLKWVLAVTDEDEKQDVSLKVVNNLVKKGWLREVGATKIVCHNIIQAIFKSENNLNFDNCGNIVGYVANVMIYILNPTENAEDEIKNISEKEVNSFLDYSIDTLNILSKNELELSKPNQVIYYISSLSLLAYILNNFNKNEDALEKCLHALNLTEKYYELLSKEDWPKDAYAILCYNCSFFYLKNKNESEYILFLKKSIIEQKKVQEKEVLFEKLLGWWLDSIPLAKELNNNYEGSDYLAEEIENMLDDTINYKLYFGALFYLGIYYQMTKGNHEKGVIWLKSALDFSTQGQKKNPDFFSSSNAFILTPLSKGLRYLGQLSESLKYAEESITDVEKNGNKNGEESYNAYENYFFSLSACNKTDKFIPALENCIKFSYSHGTITWATLSLHVALGKLYSGKENYDKALAVYEDALKRIESGVYSTDENGNIINEPKQIIKWKVRSYLGRADIYEKSEKDYTKMLDNAHKALKSAEEYSDFKTEFPSEYYEIVFTLGKSHYWLKNYSKVVEYLTESIDFYEKAQPDNVLDLSIHYMGLMFSFRVAKDIDKAIEYQEKLVNTFQKSHSDHLHDSKEMLENLYLERKQMKGY